MTEGYVPSNHHPHVDHGARTVHRPQLTFVPQVDPVPRPARSSQTWTAGWIVSGLAVLIALAAFSVVGAVGFAVLSQPGF
ncbi:hypothetical protein CIW52_13070 [Mycolicibacterium sp. P9-64]|uniref:hypothetical protein n=1 Tax=Mycolicibacterium sp. P9-64 TaxID=2024612 RepID=UPI0011EF8F0A|nr:hypothetical protein [Mycolicibacterium sp. P9-64]KAA0083349.1 hypothetical protein CIW52_13070 [Mycolicibacterium sp. P9-64]